MNSGYVDPSDLGKWAVKAYQDHKWFAGVMFWQYSTDLNGRSMMLAAGHLKEMCAQNKNCK